MDSATGTPTQNNPPSMQAIMLRLLHELCPVHGAIRLEPIHRLILIHRALKANGFNPSPKLKVREHLGDRFIFLGHEVSHGIRRIISPPFAAGKRKNLFLVGLFKPRRSVKGDFNRPVVRMTFSVNHAFTLNEFHVLCQQINTKSCTFVNDWQCEFSDTSLVSPPFILTPSLLGLVISHRKESKGSVWFIVNQTALDVLENCDALCCGHHTQDVVAKDRTVLLPSNQPVRSEVGIVAIGHKMLIVHRMAFATPIIKHWPNQPHVVMNPTSWEWQALASNGGQM